jgi:hypothetical protein
MRTGNNKRSAHCSNYRKMKKKLLLGIIAVAPGVGLCLYPGRSQEYIVGQF